MHVGGLRNENDASLGRKRRDRKYSPHENTLFSLTMFSSDACYKEKMISALLQCSVMTLPSVFGLPLKDAP